MDVVVPSLADATTLHLEVTHGLTYWNGRQTPTFTPARANVRIELSTGGQTTAVRAGEQQPDAALALAASATNRLDARIAVDGKPARVAPAGWYAVSADVVETNGFSTPVTLLFSRGSVPIGSRAAATRAVGGIGDEPTAVNVGVGQVVVASGAGTSPSVQLFAYVDGNADPWTLRSNLANEQIRGFTCRNTRGLFVG